MIMLMLMKMVLSTLMVVVVVMVRRVVIITIVHEVCVLPSSLRIKNSSSDGLNILFYSLK